MIRIIIWEEKTMTKAKTALCTLMGLLFLAACTQSYGASTAASPSASGSNPQAATLPAEATMNAIRASFLTQTAQAHSANGTAVASNTPAFSTVAPTNTGAAPVTSTTIATTAPISGTATTPTTGGAAATQTPTYAPIPSATPGLPASYVIHEGETAFCLARRFNLDPYVLLDFNLKTADYIAMPGDVLKIPVTDKKFPGQRWLIQHTPNMSYMVKSGDTIYRIGCAFGDVDPNMIVLANNLTPPDFTLTPGKYIRIP
jgi:LysM repeat protein